MAVKRLEAQKKVPAGTLQQGIAAVSVGLVNGKAVLDLDYAMDQAADVDFNVAMTESGQFMEVQGTAEGKSFSRAALNAMILLAEMGIAELIKMQKDALARAGFQLG